jgi:hypothetical protein
VNDSALWKGLMKVRHIYLRGRSYKVGNGKNISFWNDVWLDDKPLSIKYPLLYERCTDQKISVKGVANEQWVVHFKVILQGILRVQWYELAARLNLVSLDDKKDVPMWRWTSNRRFSVKSMYEHLTKDVRGFAYKRIWKSKIPEKIKIFMWLLEQRVGLTKDNMLKRNWHVNPGCYFCGAPESNDHLFFTCPIAKVIWGVVACSFKQKTRL